MEGYTNIVSACLSTFVFIRVCIYQGLHHQWVIHLGLRLCGKFAYVNRVCQLAQWGR